MMSDTSAIPAVVDPNLSTESAHMVEDMNHHTPDPQTPPLVEKIPDPITPPADSGLDELRTIVAKLAETVGVLTEAVVGMTDKDERPHGVPWTHAGSHHD